MVNIQDTSDVRPCRIILPLDKNCGEFVLVLYVCDETCNRHPTLHACGGESCWSKGRLVSLLIRLFGRSSINAGFNFVPLTIVLWTRRSAPTSDLRVTVVQ